MQATLKHVLFIVILFASTVNGQNKKIVSIPMNNDFNLITLKVSINNTPLNFIFDTGWDDNVLDETVAKKLGYDLTEKHKFPQPGGVVEFGLVDSAQLSIAGTQLQSEQFWTTPLKQFEQIIGQPIDGILGYEFMKKYMIGLSYEQSEFLIYENTYKVDARYSPIEVEAIKKEPFIYGYVTNCKGNKVKAKLKIDTGSLDFIGFNNNYAVDNFLTDSTTQVRQKKGLGGGGTTLGYEYRLDELTMGQFSLQNMVVGVTTDSKGFENRNDAGTIGGEYLHRFNWILDLGRDKVYQKKNSAFTKACGTDRTGLWIIQNKNKERMIFEVDEGSPAALVGLESGMIVESIDKKDAKSFSLFEIRQLMQKQDKKHVFLKVKEKEEISIELKNQI